MSGPGDDSVVWLRTRLLFLVSLAAIVCCVGAACSGKVGSSYGSGNDDSGVSGVFPFNGPGCPAGPPGTERNVPCGDCAIDACSGQLGCFRSECSDFYTCACACQLNDITCQNACPLSTACQACIGTARMCSDQASAGTCASQCY